MPFGMPDRRPNMVPTGSLQGTLSGNQVQPPPSPAPIQPPLPPPANVGGAEIPADYAALLGGDPYQPDLEQVPGAGRQTLDTILMALGGLLGGQGLAAIPLGILGARQNIEDIKAKNRQAIAESRKQKVDFIMKGMEQRRKDLENDAGIKLREAKLVGDEAAVQRAQQDVENARVRDAAHLQMQEAELALGQAELARARAKVEAAEDPDKDRALDTIGNYTESLMRFRQQLQAQISQGAPEPILRHVDPDTQEVTEIRGIEAIQAELEAGLAGVTNYSAAFMDPETRQALESAYDAMIVPLLDNWTEKIAQRKIEESGAKVEAARKKEMKRRSTRTAEASARRGPTPNFSPVAPGRVGASAKR